MEEGILDNFGPQTKSKEKTSERISALSLFLAKIFFFFGSWIGWVLTIVGDGAFGILSLRDKLYITVASQAGCVALCFYGIIKWKQDITGLTQVDYVIMASTLIVVIAITIQQVRAKSVLWKLETAGSILAIGSYYLLAIADLWNLGMIPGESIAWIGIALCHLVYYLISKTKGYKFFAVLQTLSGVVALGGLIHSLVCWIIKEYEFYNIYWRFNRCFF